MIDIIEKVTKGLGDRAKLMIGRCILRAVSDAKAVQLVQAQLLADEIQDDVERIQQYGYTSVPLPGAEGVVVFIGGNRDHGLLIACDDRRYRLKGLQGGEVALYDDQGQCVHLQRGGQTRVKATTKLTIEAPDTEMTGNLKVRGNIQGEQNITAKLDIADQNGAKSMAGMRAVFNGHGHPDPQGGSVGAPSGGM